MLTRLLHWLDLAFGTALVIAVSGIVATLWPTGAAQAAPVAEVRPIVEAFDSIASAGNYDLLVQAGPVAAVTVTAEPEVAAWVETVVEDHTLKIRPRRSADREPRGMVRVDITLPVLRALSLSGSGDARVGAMKTPQLRIALSGSGDASLAGVDTEVLELRISGSGDIRAAGAARRLAVKIAGSGDVTAGDLVADEVEVSIAGSGDAAVQALKSLDATIAGSGDIVYRGRPALRQRIAGSGTVVAR